MVVMGMQSAAEVTGNLLAAKQSGDVPALLARQVDPRPGVAHVAVAVATDGAAHAEGGPASVRGTRDDLECSARGVCDRTTGVCRCFSGYASSDGNGNAGTNADCGHRLPYDTSHLK